MLATLHWLSFVTSEAKIRCEANNQKWPKVEPRVGTAVNSCKERRERSNQLVKRVCRVFVAKRSKEKFRENLAIGGATTATLPWNLTQANEEVTLHGPRYNGEKGKREERNVFVRPVFPSVVSLPSGTKPLRILVSLLIVRRHSFAVSSPFIAWRIDDTIIVISESRGTLETCWRIRLYKVLETRKCRNSVFIFMKWKLRFFYF